MLQKNDELDNSSIKKKTDGESALTNDVSQVEFPDIKIERSYQT